MANDKVLEQFETRHLFLATYLACRGYHCEPMFLNEVQAVFLFHDVPESVLEAYEAGDRQMDLVQTLRNYKGITKTMYDHRTAYRRDHVQAAGGVR